MSRHRAWCFTLNNFTAEDEELIQSNAVSSSIKYLCYGHEIGESGTPHLQGYVVYASPKALNPAKSFISPRAHVQASRGNAAENRKYCSKEDTTNFFEAGAIPAQGKKKQTDEVVELIQSGASERDVASEFPGFYLTRFRGIRELINVTRSVPRDPDVPPTVLWFYGTTGTGKSRTAYELGKRFGGVFFKPNGKWYDGYNFEPVFLWDEFRDEQLKLSELLKLMDRYPLPIEKKGTSTTFNSPIIIFTTPFHPRECYLGVLENLTQLTRRITRIIEYPLNDSDKNYISTLELPKKKESQTQEIITIE